MKTKENLMALCPVCGWVGVNDIPDKCPICNTARKAFEKF